MSEETNTPGDGPEANREYKDGMFRAIFKEPSVFRGLANCVMKTDFGPDTPMEEVTLSSSIYVGSKNDVSFLMGDRLIVFTEHQSALSPNISLRLLIYAAETYKTRYSTKSLHGSRMTIPRPYFFVFYNGIQNLPPEQQMRLSDMYTEWPGPQNPPFSLDLEFTIYNINTDKAPEILHKCDMLAQYEAFVELVRGHQEELRAGYEKPMSQHDKDCVLKQAVNFAVAECMKRGILTDFLTIHGAEILYMITGGEITIEEMKEYWQEEARMDGRAEGLEEGIAKGKAETAKAMKAKGIDPATIAEITGLSENEIRQL